jgi:hypothetical protein
MLRFLDVFELVHGPNTVAVVKLDHSTVHLAKDKDALLVQKLTRHDVALREGETVLRAGWYMVGDRRVEQPMVVDGKKLGIETILKVCVCVCVCVCVRVHVHVRVYWPA